MPEDRGDGGCVHIVFDGFPCLSRKDQKCAVFTPTCKISPVWGELEGSNRALMTGELRAQFILCHGCGDGGRGQRGHVHTSRNPHGRNRHDARYIDKSSELGTTRFK